MSSVTSNWYFWIWIFFIGGYVAFHYRYRIMEQCGCRDAGVPASEPPQQTISMDNPTTRAAPSPNHQPSYSGGNASPGVPASPYGANGSGYPGAPSAPSAEAQVPVSPYQPAVTHPQVSHAPGFTVGQQPGAAAAVNPYAGYSQPAPGYAPPAQQQGAGQQQPGAGVLAAAAGLAPPQVRQGQPGTGSVPGTQMHGQQQPSSSSSGGVSSSTPSSNHHHHQQQQQHRPRPTAPRFCDRHIFDSEKSSERQQMFMCSSCRFSKSDKCLRCGGHVFSSDKDVAYRCTQHGIAHEDHCAWCGTHVFSSDKGHPEAKARLCSRCGFQGTDKCSHKER